MLSYRAIINRSFRWIFSFLEYLSEFCQDFYENIETLIDRGMSKLKKCSEDDLDSEVAQHLQSALQLSKVSNVEF